LDSSDQFLCVFANYNRALTFFPDRAGLFFLTEATYQVLPSALLAVHRPTVLFNSLEASFGVKSLSFLMLDIISRASESVRRRRRPFNTLSNQFVFSFVFFSPNFQLLSNCACRTTTFSHENNTSFGIWRKLLHFTDISWRLIFKVIKSTLNYKNSELYQRIMNEKDIKR